RNTLSRHFSGSFRLPSAVYTGAFTLFSLFAPACGMLTASNKAAAKRRIKIHVGFIDTSPEINLPSPRGLWPHTNEHPCRASRIKTTSLVRLLYVQRGSQFRCFQRVPSPTHV